MSIAPAPRDNRRADVPLTLPASLHGHFEEQSVEYMQFAFRWMNCLLMRELSVRNIVRLWDSYLVRERSYELHHTVADLSID